MVYFKKNSIFTNIGIVLSSKQNYFIYSNGLSRFYVPLKDNSLELFDVIYLEGEIVDYSFTTYESCFDFSSYLESKLIYKQINISSFEVLLPNIIKINKFYSSYIEKFNEGGKSLISKLLFNIDYNDQYLDFINKHNLFYLLSVSSLHLYLINNFLRTLFESKIKEERVDIILLMFNVSILLLSGFKISIMRYIVFNVVSILTYRKKIKLKYMYKTIVSLLIIGLFDISYLLSTSFIFNITIPFVFTISKDAISSIKKEYQNIARMIVLYLTIAFLSLLINESFSILGILLTPIFTLLILIILIVGLLTVVFPLQNIISFISIGIMKIFSFIDVLDLRIYICKENYLFYIVYLICFISMVISYENKRKIYQKVTILCIFLNVFIANVPVIERFSSSISFINVGQGDSTLVQYNGTNVLIDTGGVKNKDIAKECLIPYFKKNNIYSIDYVFLTHNDYDHVGAFESLVTSFKVKNYNKTNDFTHININGLDFINLNPSKTNEDNDDSLILYFSLNSKNYLLMGDVSTQIEKKILSIYPSLEVDVLKVGHHGSNTSTSDDLLKKYTPEKAIISCGINNYYSHPSVEVIRKLMFYDIKIYRTDLEGTIKFKK